ncbi:MAG: hypothetical protein MZU79_08735 [Anaerotruncus sp.]|nr:hypothetical protein [Anaerotruncus sp.]
MNSACGLGFGLLLSLGGSNLGRLDLRRLDLGGLDLFLNLFLALFRLHGLLENFGYLEGFLDPDLFDCNLGSGAFGAGRRIQQDHFNRNHGAAPRNHGGGTGIHHNPEQYYKDQYACMKAECHHHGLPVDRRRPADRSAECYQSCSRADSCTRPTSSYPPRRSSVSARARTEYFASPSALT